MEDQACLEVDRWRAPPRWLVPPWSRRVAWVDVGIGVRIGAMIAETDARRPRDSVRRFGTLRAPVADEGSSGRRASTGHGRLMCRHEERGNDQL